MSCLVTMVDLVEDEVMNKTHLKTIFGFNEKLVSTFKFFFQPSSKDASASKAFSESF
jgi:hypothetical protein